MEGIYHNTVRGKATTERTFSWLIFQSRLLALVGNLTNTVGFQKITLKAMISEQR